MYQKQGSTLHGCRFYPHLHNDACLNHFSDVGWGAWCFKSPTTQLFAMLQHDITASDSLYCSLPYSRYQNTKIKAPHYCPFMNGKVAFSHNGPVMRKRFGYNVIMFYCAVSEHMLKEMVIVDKKNCVDQCDDEDDNFVKHESNTHHHCHHQ